MGKLAVNIVWIKRDIRTIDHDSFNAAESENIPYLPIYIFDSDLIKHRDTSDRHLGFIDLVNSKPYSRWTPNLSLHDESFDCAS